MAGSKKSKTKTKSASRPARKKPAPPALDPLRAGMPAQDSITGVEQYGTGSKALRIIHTSERDAYDPDPAKPKKKR